tara:strand:+ start:534 stop:1538 length:1005 start_codon:yes stop_codon:yes gene_type:complete
MVFFNVFLRTLGFFSAIIFIVLIAITTSSFIPDSNGQFKFIDGNENSNNIIAIINLKGPIIGNSNEILETRVYQTISPNLVKKIFIKLEQYKPDILIFRINSPGGTVSASSDLEDIINKYKQENKVKIYFYTDEILTSGGYWVATSADKIYAAYGSVIGSIGVSGPNWYYYNTPTYISSGAFGNSIETKKQIEIFSQTAGDSKDLFNPYRKPEKNEILHLEKIVEDIYEDFVNLVSKSRKIEINEIKENIKAYIYSSKQAKSNYLIDDIITFDDLIIKLIKENNYLDYKIIENNKIDISILNLISNYLNINNKIICKEYNSSFTSVLNTYTISC